MGTLGELIQKRSQPNTLGNLLKRRQETPQRGLSTEGENVLEPKFYEYDVDVSQMTQEEKENYLLSAEMQDLRMNDPMEYERRLKGVQTTSVPSRTPRSEVFEKYDIDTTTGIPNNELREYAALAPNPESQVAYIRNGLRKDFGDGVEIYAINVKGSPELAYRNPETGKVTLVDPEGRMTLREGWADFTEAMPDIFLGAVTTAGAVAGAPAGPIGSGALSGVMGAAGRMGLNEYAGAGSDRYGPVVDYSEEGRNWENYWKPVAIEGLTSLALDAGGEIALGTTKKVGRNVVAGVTAASDTVGDNIGRITATIEGVNSKQLDDAAKAMGGWAEVKRSKITLPQLMVQYGEPELQAMGREWLRTINAFQNTNPKLAKALEGQLDYLQEMYEGRLRDGGLDRNVTQDTITESGQKLQDIAELDYLEAKDSAELYDGILDRQATQFQRPSPESLQAQGQQVQQAVEQPVNEARTALDREVNNIRGQNPRGGGPVEPAQAGAAMRDSVEEAEGKFGEEIGSLFNWINDQTTEMGIRVRPEETWDSLTRAIDLIDNNITKSLTRADVNKLINIRDGLLQGSGKNRTRVGGFADMGKMRQTIARIDELLENQKVDLANRRGTVRQLRGDVKDAEARLGDVKTELQKPVSQPMSGNQAGQFTAKNIEDYVATTGNKDLQDAYQTALRQEPSPKSLDQLVLDPGTKRIYEEALKPSNMSTTNRVMLSGSPGVGKTSLVDVMENSGRFDIRYIDGNNFTKRMKELREQFDKQAGNFNNDNWVFVFDEGDSIFRNPQTARQFDNLFGTKSNDSFSNWLGRQKVVLTTNHPNVVRDYYRKVGKTGKAMPLEDVTVRVRSKDALRGYGLGYAQRTDLIDDPKIIDDIAKNSNNFSEMQARLAQATGRRPTEGNFGRTGNIADELFTTQTTGLKNGDELANDIKSNGLLSDAETKTLVDWNDDESAQAVVFAYGKEGDPMLEQVIGNVRDSNTISDVIDINLPNSLNRLYKLLSDNTNLPVEVGGIRKKPVIQVDVSTKDGLERLLDLKRLLDRISKQGKPRTRLLIAARQNGKFDPERLIDSDANFNPLKRRGDHIHPGKGVSNQTAPAPQQAVPQTAPQPVNTLTPSEAAALKAEKKEITDNIASMRAQIKTLREGTPTGKVKIPNEKLDGYNEIIAAQKSIEYPNFTETFEDFDKALQVIQNEVNSEGIGSELRNRLIQTIKAMDRDLNNALELAVRNAPDRKTANRIKRIQKESARLSAAYRDNYNRLRRVFAEEILKPTDVKGTTNNVLNYKMSDPEVFYILKKFGAPMQLKDIFEKGVIGTKTQLGKGKPAIWAVRRGIETEWRRRVLVDGIPDIKRHQKFMDEWGDAIRTFFDTPSLKNRFDKPMEALRKFEEQNAKVSKDLANLAENFEARVLNEKNPRNVFETIWKNQFVDDVTKLKQFMSNSQSVTDGFENFVGNKFRDFITDSKGKINIEKIPEFLRRHGSFLDEVFPNIEGDTFTKHFETMYNSVKALEGQVKKQEELISRSMMGDPDGLAARIANAGSPNGVFDKIWSSNFPDDIARMKSIIGKDSEVLDNFKAFVMEDLERNVNRTRFRSGAKSGPNEYGDPIQIDPTALENWIKNNRKKIEILFENGNGEGKKYIRSLEDLLELSKAVSNRMPSNAGAGKASDPIGFILQKALISYYGFFTSVGRTLTSYNMTRDKTLKYYLVQALLNPNDVYKTTRIQELLSNWYTKVGKKTMFQFGGREMFNSDDDDYARNIRTGSEDGLYRVSDEYIDEQLIKAMDNNWNVWQSLTRIFGNIL